MLYQFILYAFHVCVLYFTCVLFVFFAVAVCECHIEIKGYLLTYLLFSQLLEDVVALNCSGLRSRWQLTAVDHCTNGVSRVCARSV